MVSAIFMRMKSVSRRHPATPPGRPLTAKELERLRTSIQSVLREAITLGGSSVSDYVDASGEKGFFQLEHKVYLRTGEPCLVCGTPIAGSSSPAVALTSVRTASTEFDL